MRTALDCIPCFARQALEAARFVTDAPGTILNDCGESFRRRFAEADLIIAKGQGNFETLSDEAADICFLFKVKCPVIANHVGLPVGTHVLSHRTAASSATGGKNHARI